MEIQKDIDLFYLRCSKCGEPLNKYYETDEVGGLHIERFRFLKCPECGEVYSGYEYKIINDKIEYFKLVK